MKIKTLTPAQQQLMPGIRDKWLNKLYGCNTRIDRAKATEGINWLYEFSGLEKPIIIYVDSPLACQYAVTFIKSILNVNIDKIDDQVGVNLEEQVWHQVRVKVKEQIEEQVLQQVRYQVRVNIESQVRERACSKNGHPVVREFWDRAWKQIRNQVWDQVDRQALKFLVRDSVHDLVKDQVYDQVGNKVRNQVEDQVEPEVWQQVLNQFKDEAWDQVWMQVKNQVRDSNYYYLSTFGKKGDYGWVSTFDYFKTIGILQHENFEKFSNLINSGIYDMIQLKIFCIVSELPVKICRNNQNRFHGKSGSAIEWADGYSQYYWNGVPVTKKIIETPHLITKQEILKELNAEVRRCFREKLGAEEYYNRLGGVILIDEDTDDQANIMMLFRSKEIDAVINKYVQYLQVICPSTKRQYILYPPNQKSTNVWEAKASTFQDEKIQYRHGDVGLLNVNKQFSKPLIES